MLPVRGLMLSKRESMAYELFLAETKNLGGFTRGTTEGGTYRTIAILMSRKLSKEISAKQVADLYRRAKIKLAGLEKVLKSIKGKEANHFGQRTPSYYDYPVDAYDGRGNAR